jgi:site-specific recombinase XerD
MGHEDIASTTIYTLVTDESEAAAITRLDWGAS